MRNFSMKKFGTPTGTGPGSASDIVGFVTVGTPCSPRRGSGPSSRVIARRRSGEIVCCARGRRVAHFGITWTGMGPSLLKLVPGSGEPEHHALFDVPAGPANPSIGSGDVKMGAGLEGVTGWVCCCGAGAGACAACGSEGGAAGAVAVSGAGAGVLVVDGGAGVVVVLCVVAVAVVVVGGGAGGAVAVV